MKIWLPLGLAFVTSILFVPGVRWLSLRFGRVARPRGDRWHQEPTPILGGVGIFAAFVLSLALISGRLGGGLDVRWGVVLGAAIVFTLGLIDDLHELTPPAKLVGQILAAAAAIMLGFTTNFFTPRIANPFIAQIPNILLTFFWLVAITNAINLLDNMDGLAGGISLIAAGLLAYFFWRSGDQGLLSIALALAGATLGFLVFNFPPASIFMGDSGSLMLGFTLAVLAIARQPQASNLFAVMGVPTMIFLLPILDTTLVTFTRLLRGQSPAQGGRDHTSHRLIAFGLSERQAVVTLYVIAVISGIAAIGVETLDYWLSLVLVPVLVILLALLAAYLGRIKVVTSDAQARGGAIMRLVAELTYKRRLLEIFLDFALIGISWYLAFWAYYRLALDESQLDTFLRSLPVAYAGAFVAFFAFGVYRGMWRYVSVDDLLRFGKATGGSVVLAWLAIWIILPRGAYPLGLFVLFAVFLFLGLAATRSTFKILDQVYGHQERPEEAHILILGAGDAGEMALRWILMNPQFGYHVIGFLDDDPYNAGRQIHGVNILGGVSSLEALIRSQHIDGVVLTAVPSKEETAIRSLIDTCKKKGIWVRSLRLEFELLGGEGEPHGQ